MVLRLLVYIACTVLGTLVYKENDRENVSAAEKQPNQEKDGEKLQLFGQTLDQKCHKHKPRKQKFGKSAAELMEKGREQQRQSRNKKTQKRCEIAGFHH